MNILIENPYISGVEIAKLTNISLRAVEKQLAKLKNEGKIKREGSKKTGKWIVLNNT